MFYPRGELVDGYTFGMINRTDGSAITSGTITGYISQDGGAQVALTNAVTHKGNGQAAVDITAAEMTAHVIGIVFIHTDAVPLYVTLLTRRLIKGAAIDGLPFGTVATADGTAITSGTVTCYVTKDDGAQAGGKSPIHHGNGQWTVGMPAAAMNADVVGVLLTHASAIPVQLTLHTVGESIPASDSVFDQCLTAVRNAIVALSLEGIEDADVRKQKLPWDRSKAYPGIFVCPTTERIAPATNRRNDVGYAVAIAMVRASNQNLTAGMDLFLYWRERIRQALEDQPLSGVDEIYTVTIEPGAVYLPDAFANQFDAGALVARCISREPLSAA